MSVSVRKRCLFRHPLGSIHRRVLFTVESKHSVVSLPGSNACSGIAQSSRENRVCRGRTRIFLVIYLTKHQYGSILIN